jgi:hypothetical protein
MDIHFAHVSDADCARLAYELRLELLKAGVPNNAISLKPGSDEHMSMGSVLLANAEHLAHLFGAAGYIACFGKCMYEVLHRNKNNPNATIVINTRHGSVEIPARADIEAVEKALNELNKEPPTK